MLHCKIIIVVTSLLQLSHAGYGGREAASQNPVLSNQPIGQVPDNSYDNGQYDPGRFNQNAGGYNQNPVGYNQNPAGYNQNQGGYNQNQGGYNQNPSGYNQNARGYDQNRGGYNQNAGGYDQNRRGYNQNEYDQNRGGYDQNSGYNQNNRGYNQNPNGYNPNQNPNGYNTGAYNPNLPNGGGYGQGQGQRQPNYNNQQGGNWNGQNRPGINTGYDQGQNQPIPTEPAPTYPQYGQNGNAIPSNIPGRPIPEGPEGYDNTLGVDEKGCKKGQFCPTTTKRPKITTTPYNRGNGYNWKGVTPDGRDRYDYENLGVN